MAYPLHGGQLRQIAERFAIPESELLDFSANINPAGPPPAVLATLRASLDDLATLTAYPDLQQTDLKRSIARYTGTDPENVIVANGFVPLLEAALRTLRVQTCLLPVPAFVEYRRTLERLEIAAAAHPLSASSNFRYDAPPLLAASQDAILLANPQNPSGILHDAPSIRDLVAQASATSTAVMLDEAFIDYVPEHSLAPAVDQFSNLIVFRSVTKFHGIPGLRVAYALANPTLARAISDNLPPWPITTLASHAVIAALADEPYAASSRSENRAARASLQAELEACGFQVYPSQANFLLFRLPPLIDPDLFWRTMMLDHRIVLRSCANYEALAEGHFRVAVRTDGENRKLASAIADAIRQLQRAGDR
jgi:threonine-phosphate decarboxylase